jgi:hypothetical protein
MYKQTRFLTACKENTFLINNQAVRQVFQETINIGMLMPANGHQNQDKPEE